MKKLVIFDLDGTLLDTVKDLAACVNYALETRGCPTHDIDAYKHFVGNGINNLLKRASPENMRTEEDIQLMRELFIPYYAEHDMDYTRPYDGIPQLLEQLQDKGVKLAVASNKYQSATEKLVKIFFPAIKFEAVLGQREGVPVKPDPTIVFEILDSTGTGAADTLYIGDSGVDMQTASRAGVESAGVTWGFRTEEELRENGSIHIVSNPDEITGIVF